MSDTKMGAFGPGETRYCPRCTYPLVRNPHAQSEIDYCTRCQGTLVEPGGAIEQFGEFADPKVWVNKLGNQTTGEQLGCPACKNTMQGFQVPFEFRSVVVDHCGSCGALWLDRGEGQKLAEIVAAAAASGALNTTSGGQAILSDDELAHSQDRERPPGMRLLLFQFFTGLPIEVFNPVYRRPWITQSFVVLMTLIFLAQFAMFASSTEREVMEFLRMWGVVPELVGQGQNLHGLLTHAFLHGSFAHLVSNMYFLWIFGDNVEDRIGRVGFIVLFVLSALSGAVLQIVFQQNATIPMVGASGAVAGLMAAYLMLFPRVKLWVMILIFPFRIPVWIYIAFWIGVQFLMASLNVPGVGWFAHIGGFMTGLLVGWLMRDVPHPAIREG